MSSMGPEGFEHKVHFSRRVEALLLEPRVETHSSLAPLVRARLDSLKLRQGRQREVLFWTVSGSLLVVGCVAGLLPWARPFAELVVHASEKWALGQGLMNFAALLGRPVEVLAALHPAGRNTLLVLLVLLQLFVIRDGLLDSLRGLQSPLRRR